MEWLSQMDMGNIEGNCIRDYCNNPNNPHKTILNELMSRISEECKNIVFKAVRSDTPFAIHLNLRRGGRPKVMAAIYFRKSTGLKMQSRGAVRGFVESTDAQLKYEKDGIESSDVPRIINYLRGQ